MTTLKYILLCLLVPSCSVAQSYSVSLIPDSLKKDANMVIRAEEKIFEIKSPGKATIREKHVYTILNEAGDKYADYTSHYDKFININYINATLYDASGKEVKKVKKKDMEDLSGTEEGTLIADLRYKYFDFHCRNYPYTVEFEEEDDEEGLLSFGGWLPQYAPHVSVASSRHVIIAPKDYQVRYRAANGAPAPTIKEDGSKKLYTWQLGNMTALPWEPVAPFMNQISPLVLFAPSEFEIEGYKGNMNSWIDYGKFMNQLLAGKDVLPDDIKAKVHQLADPLSDPRQKINVLYDFLQKNTRYISIQLGIGGWQPFDAKYVATKKYGDCKALSNYMVALLKEAGVPARYVEITAGANAKPLVDDFPSLQGNHVIACVPLAGDTVWLECTSQTQLPGFMGSFTGDRKGILIDQDGAHIVNTPRYGSNDNLQVRNVKGTIDAEGNLDAQLDTRFTGLQLELPRALIYEVNAENRQRYLNEAIGLPTYQVTESKYEDEKTKVPAVKEHLHITAPSYASITGKRIFLAPNLFNKTSTKYPSDTARRFPVMLSDAWKDIDSVTITIPAGYQAESIPQDVVLNSPYGKYTCSVKVEGDKIFYHRQMEKWRASFPASDYASLVEFQDKIYKADHSRVVLVKKE